MGLYKILKIVAAILGLVGVVLWVMLVAKGDDTVKATGEGVDPFMYVGYAMFAIILLFVIIFVLKGVFAGNLKKTLISVGAFLAVVVIAYVLSDGSDTAALERFSGGDEVTESTSKWVGTGLKTFYILAIAAVGSMLLSGIKKIAK